MNKITLQYLEDHSDIHTPESWGRAVIEELINQAKANVSDKGESEEVEFDVKVKFNPVVSKVCLNLCIGSKCIHIKL